MNFGRTQIVQSTSSGFHCHPVTYSLPGSGNHHPTFSLNLTILDTPHKKYPADFTCLMSDIFSITSLGFICTAASTGFLFFVRLKNLPFCVYTTCSAFIHSSRVIGNNAAVTVSVQSSFGKPVFNPLRCQSKSEIARSSGSFFVCVFFNHALALKKTLCFLV